MNSKLSCPVRIIVGCSTLFTVLVFIAPQALGQDYGLPLISAPPPPPMKFVSRNERTALSAARDAKSRTRAAIEMAEARLARAEQLTAGQQFEEASSELGVYQGLVEDAMNYLENAGLKKQRDLFKRLELALRSHGARLEAIRRVTPLGYAVHVKAICECARSARTQALNAFYGDTVIREVTADAGQHSGGHSSKESAPDSVKKQ